MLSCLLLELKKINKLMSSYQIVRVAFQYLGELVYVSVSVCLWVFVSVSVCLWVFV